MELTSTQKGGLAELKIAAAAADLEIGVYRPMIEGNRCDLVFEIGDRLLRIQCKWANRRGDGGCPDRRGTSSAIPWVDGQTVTGSATSGRSRFCGAAMSA